VNVAEYVRAALDTKEAMWVDEENGSKDDMARGHLDPFYPPPIPMTQTFFNQQIIAILYTPYYLIIIFHRIILPISGITALLRKKRELLEEYFCISINEEGFLIGMPDLLEGYFPDESGLPFFLLRIATETGKIAL